MARVYVGDGNSLNLVSLHVSVAVDGPRARTVVDHVFYNPHGQQLEGTFEYPLPSGASPSNYAMFISDGRTPLPSHLAGPGRTASLPSSLAARPAPAAEPDPRSGPVASSSPAPAATPLDNTDRHTDWGRLQEARVVPKDKAKETYEDVTRAKIDPALLEYGSGNTFRGRVYPIPPHGYNRVILVYEELLPLVEGQLLYRFPLPDHPVADVRFTLSANLRECKYTAFLPGDAAKVSDGGQIVYAKTWTNETPREGVALFAATPPQPTIQAVCGQMNGDGPYHLYARLRPDLKKIEKVKPFASRAVFLLDTSQSEHADRFNVNMKLLKKILESDPDLRQFNILTFNAGSAWVEPHGWINNDAAGREKALAALDGILLEGATDLDAALTRLGQLDFAVADGSPLNVFLLSDGHITWGEREAKTVVGRFQSRMPNPCRFWCYRVGLGAENAELFESLARTGGGVFSCLTDPEIDAAATAHRSLCFMIDGIRFRGGPEASDILLPGRQTTVHPGGELVVAAKLNGPATGELIVDGHFQGHPLSLTFPLDSGSNSPLAARAWGEVAVSSLLALGDPKLDPLVTAYCQQYGIASRTASFLVLENDSEYKRLNIDQERGKTIDGDLGAYIRNLWQQTTAVKTGRQAFMEFLDAVEPKVKLLQGQQCAYVKELLAQLKDEDFELPPSELRGAIVHKADVPAAYLAERDQDRRKIATYLQEARRRSEAGDRDGAIRVLSSVIEEYPAREDALRLVAYRLLDLKQPEQAVQLFQQVQQRCPYEPHSYRDLARSLEDSGFYGVAAVQHEIALAGTWHSRFAGSLKQVIQEEYILMMQRALRGDAVSKDVADLFRMRLAQFAPQPPCDLRVTIGWNTDATDVDLIVVEPDGTACTHSSNRTKNGGELSQNQNQGYGPERYQTATALPGEYTIKVRYNRTNPNLLGGETHVHVVVTRLAGTEREMTEQHTVVLSKAGEEAEVCKVK